MVEEHPILLTVHTDDDQVRGGSSRESSKNTAGGKFGIVVGRGESADAVERSGATSAQIANQNPCHGPGVPKHVPRQTPQRKEIPKTEAQTQWLAAVGMPKKKPRGK